MGTGIASSHSSHLLQAIGGLKHPAWGSWNFLIYTLRNLYHNNLEIVNSKTLKKLEQATLLDTLLQTLDSNVKTSETSLWISTLYKIGKRKPAKRGLSLQKLITDIPNHLRNQIAHNSPDDEYYWQNIAEALKPLIQFLTNNA
jgi:hypothetical protein